MQRALVDFHLHTTCSDGSWSPERLFQEIRQRKLEYFCVSDHDNMDAYPVPADLAPRCIAGLEVDTYGLNQTIHVLAYGMSGPSGDLMSRLAQQRINRTDRARQIVEKLNTIGVDLTYEHVLQVAKTTRSVGRPHIARALVATKHCDSIQQAFDEYLADGGRAYVGLERLSTTDAVALIHEAKGLAILAHPRRIRDQDRLAEICRSFDGIEALHPSADAGYERQMLEFSDAAGLLVTGGTDFHGRPDELGIGVSFPRSRVNALLGRLGR